MIPGHGGIMDRFDCQFLMATFVNVYISSFIRTASPAKLLQQVVSQISKSFIFVIPPLKLYYNMFVCFFLFADLQSKTRATASTLQFAS